MTKLSLVLLRDVTCAARASFMEKVRTKNGGSEPGLQVDHEPGVVPSASTYFAAADSASVGGFLSSLPKASCSAAFLMDRLLIDCADAELPSESI